MRIVSVSGTIGRLAACVEVASILLVSSAALAAPQLVLVNAKVFTADPALPYAQAVAIEDGRILAVGSNDQVRALTGPNTRIIDAGGRLVTPGLTEASWFRRRRQGTEPVSESDAGRAGPSDPSEAITREQALTAYTSGGAFAEGQEAGTAAPGFAADLAVLSQDVLTVPTNSSRRRRVCLRW